MNNIFMADVMSQATAMQAAIASYRGYHEIFKKISELKPSRVIFAGMGSSHYASIAASIRLNQGGLVSNVYAASELLHYEWQLVTPDTLLVLTSQSGESGEIVDIVKKLSPDQFIIGITNEAESTLGQRANIRLDMAVEPEVSVSSRTYLASLVLLDILAAALLGDPVDASLAECQKAIEALDIFLQEQALIQEKMAEFLGYPATVCYIGRGPAVGTAEASALFTREAAKYPALAFDSAEFRHGPFEMIDSHFRAIVYAPAGVTYELQQNLACDIAEHGGKAILVTDTAATFISNNVLTVKHPAVPENYAPIVQILVAQLFANDMALHQGYKPWIFHHASKVTTKQ